MPHRRRELARRYALDEIRRADGEWSLADVLTASLERAGFDLRSEPSLEEMKAILVEVLRAARDLAPAEALATAD